jgi:carbonic anhydrase/acetyltransferase-like protein (isoleucine patch superfamily)
LDKGIYSTKNCAKNVQKSVALVILTFPTPLTDVPTEKFRFLLMFLDFWPQPDLSQAAFVAPNATIVGAVTIGQDASIWYQAVVRGDVEGIIIGDRSNVQDGAVLHGDPGKPTVLEADVTIGHRAVIHSAHIESGCLIGIGSIVLDGVRVGSGSIVGAGAVVTKDVPPRSLVVGIPGKVVRQLSEDEAQDLIIHAHHYVKLAQVHNGTGTDLGFQS